MEKRYNNAYLPDPFVMKDGSRVTSPDQWPRQAAYIRELAQECMYGTWPGKAGSVSARVVDTKKEAFGQIMRERIVLTIDEKWPLNMEFAYPPELTSFPVIVFNANPMSMRCRIERDVIAAGYGIASFDREMIRPDYQLAEYGGYLEQAKAREYPSLACGDIMAWAWGHSLVADYLRTRGEVRELICTGHSRGGKAALCAGVFDERFDIVAPIGSGCGGAGCARFSGTLALDKQDETKCETIGSMAHMFPTWMCEKYAEFGPAEAPYRIGREVESLPIDAHMLRAACAPRAVFDSEGEEDFWTNSFGAQLCRDAAQKVFDFLGVSERNGFHMRPGGHDFNGLDWSALIDFCDIVLRRERKLPQANTTKRVYMIDVKKYAPWA